MNMNGGAPPSVPARRHSRAGGNQSDGSCGGERPPQRPPKPGRLQQPPAEIVDSNRLADMDDEVTSRKSDSGGATAANGPENAEWYEYGCV